MSSKTFDHIIHMWRKCSISNGHSVERLEVMDHLQSPSFLFHSKECGLIRSTRWFIFSTAHLFFHNLNYFLTSRLRQPNQLPLPGMVRHHSYHIIVIVLLTKCSVF